MATLVLASFLGTGSAHTRTQDKQDTKLAVHMKAINQAYRKLRSSLKDPERNAESLAQVLEIEQNAFAAKGLEPAQLVDVPQAERKAFLVEYRRTMVGLLKGILDLEVAVLEDKNEAASDLLKEINKMKLAAHKRFRIDSDDDK
jgi:hypothetical protein